MIQNPAVRLSIEGVEHDLVYTWAALDALRADLGPEFDTAIVQALAQIDFAVIAKAVAAGTGLSPAAVMSASPPIVPTANAIRAALGLAFHGPDPEATREAGRPLASRARAILSATRSGLGWALARIGRRSGR